MNSLNSQIGTPERIKICSIIGFPVEQAISYRNGSHLFRNHLRNDKEPNLFIDFKTGLVKDFANSYYDGDIISLYAKAKNMPVNKAISQIRKEIRNLDDSYKSKSKKINHKPKTKKPMDFWTEEKLKRLKYCQKKMNSIDKYDITKCMTYDGILNITLQYFKCGIYPSKFKDHNFGLYDKDIYIPTYFAFPYRTGCQLYTRDKNNDKIVQNIYESSTNSSFFWRFNKKQKNKKFNIVTIMKSPRECMNIWQHIDRQSTFPLGMACGENSFSLSEYMKKQIKTVVSDTTKYILVFGDCDTATAYETSKNNAETIRDFVSNQISDMIQVKLVNIHKSSENKFKDFTDIIRNDINSVCSGGNVKLKLKKYIYYGLKCMKSNNNLFMKKPNVDIFKKCIKEAEQI